MVTDIAIFFEPVIDEENLCREDGTVGARIQTFSDQESFPKISKGTFVLFGILENRNSTKPTNHSGNLSEVRQSLYELKDHFNNIELVDLGNIGAGESISDSYYALTHAVASIIRQGGIAITLGGSQDLTYPIYLAYEQLEQVVNVVSVDSRFDLGDAAEEPKSDKYLQKIILHQPNILFNFSNLGYQTHHVKSVEVELLKKMYFDIYRLGEVQQSIENVEPVIRNADMITFDLTSIRGSDYPANQNNEPNGFYGEQACAVARYAGLSDKLTSFSLYDCVSGAGDVQSAQLISQIIWYFLFGASKRMKDYPFADKSEYTKYTVTLKNGKYDIVFYKSPLSDRWWMEVPYPSTRGEKYERHFMVPCAYSDYQKACEDEVPDRWWQTFQKLG